MKRILFFHNEFPCGGAERATIDIANYLSSFGYEFFVLACKKKAEVPNVRVIEMTISDWNSLSGAELFINAINFYSIDIFVLPIHLFKHLDYIMEQTCCKLVFALHSIPLWEVKTKMAAKQKRARYSFLKKIELYLFSYPKANWFGVYNRQFLKQYENIYSLSDAYVVLCEDYKLELFRRMKLPNIGDKFYVIPNSEQVVEDVNLNKKKQILFVGRLSYADKRVDRLIDIWKMIYKKVPDWELIIVGEGEEESALRMRVSKKNIQRVRFTGYDENVSTYYQDASVLCLTSTFEGWGLCLTEAQANGVVPIAFDSCAGVHQILAPSGVNGFLIPPFKKQLFAETLLNLLNSPDKLVEMRNNVLLKVRDYSPQVVREKWMDLFESLLK